MIRQLYWAAMVLIFSVSGCSTIHHHQDLFYVSYKNADMPVWIKGNTGSGIFIIYFHGGPCGSCLLFSNFKAFKKLEEDFAVVYWCQRMSGSSGGNPPPETVSLAQWCEDAGQVTDVIKLKYHPKAIYIMGHSFGGRLAKQYLVDYAATSPVTGYIEIDGVHNMAAAHALSRDWVMDYAAEAGRDPEITEKKRRFWMEALEWYENNPVITLQNRPQHYAYLRKAGAYYYQGGVAAKMILANLLSVVVFTPYADYTAAQNHKQITDVHRAIRDEYCSDLDLERITLPVLICWGEHDGVLRPDLAYDLRERLGTPAADKQRVIFNNSGHAPQFEEPQKFYESAKAFIVKYSS